MLLFKGCDIEKVTDIAEDIRKKFSETKFKKSESKTVSIGVTEIKIGENSDTACLRVDSALY